MLELSESKAKGFKTLVYTATAFSPAIVTLQVAQDLNTRWILRLKRYKKNMT